MRKSVHTALRRASGNQLPHSRMKLRWEYAAEILFVDTEKRAAGIVLCGGRSSRMGRPKAWLPFGNELLLQRLVRVLSEAVSPVIVVAAPGQEVPNLPGSVEIVRDDLEYLGPLNGLATGLAALGDRAEIAYLSSCDLPFLNPALVRAVVAALGDADVCLPAVGGHRHPLAGVYRVRILPTLRERIAAGDLRLGAIADQLRTRVLGDEELRVVDPELMSLRNVNTPIDYSNALREAGYIPLPDPDRPRPEGGSTGRP
jgi:molybdopterin-guanine dinucleotide biosynthesis protein A